MKNSKKVLAATIGAALLSTATIIPTASAEVSASVGVANMYLWRGYDLGSGDPAVSGDINISGPSGIYGGVWASSGDSVAGTEYDPYIGWGGKVGAVDLDVSYWSYVYPSSPTNENTSIGDLADVVVSAGIGPVTATLYEQVAGEDPGVDARYITLGAESGKFSGLLGFHKPDSGTEDPIHLDLGYSYNDNLSFTVSKFIDDEPANDDAKFVVSYSLPIK